MNACPSFDPQARSRVWKLGSNIDTDQLVPGVYMKLDLDDIAPHCLEVVRPEFAAQVRPSDVIAAGPNFGIGSSREQAAGALVKLGLRAVVAPSFNGLYFRNAFNLGLLLLTCPRATDLDDGEVISLDLARPAVLRVDGTALACEPIPGFLMDMVQVGGLLNVLRQKYRR